LKGKITKKEEECHGVNILWRKLRKLRKLCELRDTLFDSLSICFFCNVLKFTHRNKTFHIKYD